MILIHDSNCRDEVLLVWLYYMEDDNDMIIIIEILMGEEVSKWTNNDAKKEAQEVPHNNKKIYTTYEERLGKNESVGENSTVKNGRVKASIAILTESMQSHYWIDLIARGIWYKVMIAWYFGLFTDF